MLVFGIDRYVLVSAHGIHAEVRVKVSALPPLLIELLRAWYYDARRRGVPPPLRVRFDTHGTTMRTLLEAWEAGSLGAQRESLLSLTPDLASVNALNESLFDEGNGGIYSLCGYGAGIYHPDPEEEDDEEDPPVAVLALENVAPVVNDEAMAASAAPFEIVGVVEDSDEEEDQA